MILISFFSLIILLFYYVHSILVKNHDYWVKRKVPYLKPIPLFGNYMDYIFMRKSAPIVASEICRRFPNEPYIGTFYGTAPALLVLDPEIIKLILVNDFHYFSGREATDYKDGETITSNIFFNGGEEWKALRQNLTPLFTSSKIKKMFPLIKDCATEFDSFLDVEIKLNQTHVSSSLLSRYTIECIISAGFGINANAMKRVDEVNPFVVIGEKIFETSVKQVLRLTCRGMWPSLFYRLGFKIFEEEITTFFNNLYKKVSVNRVNSQRNDFLDLILEWRHKKYITADSKLKTDDKNFTKIKVTEDLLAAQCLLIFAAGFETTATLMNYLLYELAKNKRVQDLVIEEIDEYLQKRDGDIDFECVTKLPYTEACLDETLRVYPVLGLLTREVMEEYTLPTGLKLQKGDRIHVPIHDIHRNPDNFPEPEVFRPERFLDEERNKVKQFTYLPFGEGPRICMGPRFAKMKMHAGLVTILKKYRIELAEGMPLKLEFRATGLVTQPTTDIRLKFIRRNE